MRKKALVGALVAICVVWCLSSAGAQSAIVPPSAYRTTERSDFSIYKNGKYLGHAYRETRGSIAPVGPDPSAAGSFVYAGDFYVLEETLRDMRNAARSVDRSASSRFSLAPGGTMRFSEDSGYPSFRGLPALPEGELEPGTSWVAPGERCVELPGAAGPVRIPFLAEYRFVGKTEYRGKAAWKLTAKFATRYRGGRGADPLESATGTHDLDMTIDAETGAPLFIRDRFDETFTLAGGTERHSGFNLIFYEGTAPLDRSATVAALSGAPRAEPRGDGNLPLGVAPRAGAGPDGGVAGGRAAAAQSGPEEDTIPEGAGPGPLIAGAETGLDESASAEPLLPSDSAGALGAAGVELDESAAGVVLRVRDLRFVADSDQILQSELWRLDAIAASLSAIPGRRFLVEGHSAAVGKAAGELELSNRRASRVAAELVARGIDPSLIMYRGLGSSHPIAPNDTEEGRARNRRVEITILDY